MEHLERLLYYDQFIALMGEGKKDPHSSGWDDCLLKVKEQILQDRTTTKDNLREKAESYARNYLYTIPELPSADKDGVVKEIADEVEKNLQDVSFDQRPHMSLGWQTPSAAHSQSGPQKKCWRAPWEVA